MWGFFRQAVPLGGLLVVPACGIAESSRGSGDGDSQEEASGGATTTGSGGVGTGGTWTQESLPGCFSSFGLDQDLLLQDLEETEQAIVCSLEEQMFSCVHPEDHVCTYLGAIFGMAGDEEALATCLEQESGCLAGTIFNPVDFECRVFGPLACPGTVGELETCFRDYLDDLATWPPIEWTCENSTEVVNWMTSTAVDLPESCAAFDGCAL